MAQMGKYCKAYQVFRFREFAGWKENYRRKNTDPAAERSASDDAGQPLSDSDILYLHEDLVLTDGVYRDENIVLDEVSDAWREFCEKTLEFEIPDYVYQKPGK